MHRLWSFMPSASVIRFAFVGAIAFSLGAASIAAAGPAISGLVGLVDGNNTAAINASRELSVTDATAAARLGSIDSRLGATLQVAVANAPTVTLAGTPNVNVASMPSVNVASMPSVTIGSMPAVAISGTPTVNIAGMPAVQLAGTPAVKSGDTTSVIFNASSGTLNGATSFSFTSSLDVTAYKSIRVYVSCFGTSQCTQVHLFIWSTVPNTFAFGQLDEFPIASGLTTARAYDTPGQQLQIFAQTPNQDPLNNMLLQVFIVGRTN